MISHHSVHHFFLRTFHAALTIAALAVLSPLSQAADAIKPAPAFKTEQLTQLPTDNWITNGGNLSNQRYSPLKQINLDNIKGVKAVWRADLNTGLDFRHNNQAQPLVYDGVVYIVSGQDDVFAISVETGEIIWEYRSGLADSNAFVCCGWVSRGLGIGDGKIFLGRIDAKLMALDQKTGKPLWTVETGDPKLGYSLTAAPLYYDGMVITGNAGGDLGTRGWVRAFSAKDGTEIWRFNTIPGPGEFGHDTWPQEGKVWEWGGAPVWHTPALDPELGLLYFSTGNAGPVLGGAARPGDNLFTASIVAIDVRTGKYRWHFQEVHHDLWDYDAPNPIILFDAPYNGVMRKGMVQAGKTGFLYILDRATGQPLIGIEEKPVMQEPKQATAATQPFPIGDALVPQDIEVAPEDFALVNQGRIFTPFTDQPVIYKPMAAVNWPPSAYDPTSNLMYVCATDNANGARTDASQFEKPTLDAQFLGGAYVGAGTIRSGIYTAQDLKTNKMVWQKRFNDGCRSGSLATAGGLVFTGRNDGRLTALNAKTGDRVWEFMLDAPVNSAISSFMYKGQQYLVTYAGGGLFGGPKGDGVWLFSLNGTLDPVKPAAATSAAPRTVNPPSPGRVADMANGAAIYKAACIYCHGEKGTGGEGGGKSLSAGLTVDSAFAVMSTGRNAMPNFGVSMTAEQLHDVASYVVKELVKKP
jgi:quinohemoprotein ethanol dehydrogenase